MHGPRRRVSSDRWFARAIAAIAPILVCAVSLAANSPAPSTTAPIPAHKVMALKITVLVTNLAGDMHAGDGEWWITGWANCRPLMRATSRGCSA
jgi:hypothetical protein